LMSFPECLFSKVPLGMAGVAILLLIFTLQ
jgi:hypothetical protein